MSHFLLKLKCKSFTVWNGNDYISVEYVFLNAIITIVIIIIIIWNYSYSF